MAIWLLGICLKEPTPIVYRNGVGPSFSLKVQMYICKRWVIPPAILGGKVLQRE